MTRKEIEENYEVKDGIIQSPGKFEAELVYIPYFWDFYMNGWEDDRDYFDGVPFSGYVVTEEDRKEFPELVGIYGVILYESGQGFVNSQSFETKEKYEDYFVFADDVDEEEAV